MWGEGTGEQLTCKAASTIVCLHLCHLACERLVLQSWRLHNAGSRSSMLQDAKCPACRLISSRLSNRVQVLL